MDHAHNGMSLLSDGMMVTRNLEHNHNKKTVFTIFDLSTREVVMAVEFVGASIGRFWQAMPDNKITGQQGIMVSLPKCRAISV